MHLVRWEVLLPPFSKGGVQIRDPGLANLAMVGKLVWWLFYDPKHPVSKMAWGTTTDSLTPEINPFQYAIEIKCLTLKDHTSYLILDG